MLSYNDLKPGIEFIKDGNPYAVLDYLHVKKQRGKPVVQLKIKNLISGKVIDYTARQNENFEDANIEKIPAEFIYENRGEYWFKDPKNPSKRFSINEEIIKEDKYYLKEGIKLTAIEFKNEIINIELPVKVDLLVTEAPPNIKGNTTDGGTKQIKLETGLKINAPLFIERGDTVKVNTQKGEYAERVNKN
ncbi:MAG: elongation factor P [Candidatus Paceibacterota bacterium]